MGLNVKKIKRNKVFQVIVDQIEEAILKGELKPDDKLPPEMKLTEMFAASRSSVREALRILEQKGLVRIKRGAGGGAVVQEINTKKVTEGLSLLLQAQHARFDHMAEFREVIEGGLTALAATRVDDQGLARLKRILETARRILETDRNNWRAFYSCDIEFHIEVANIADNPVFTAFLCMLHRDILGADDRFAVPDHTLMERNYQDLLEITDALEKRNPESASHAAREHVRRFSDYMKMQEEMFAMPSSRRVGA